MGEAQKIVLPYSPRWHQAKAHALMAAHRFGVFVCHRRFGKTVMSINEAIKTLVECKYPHPQGHYVAPFYSQAKRVAWQYVKDFTVAIPGMKYNQSELCATFPNSAKFQLLGGDNYDSHRGIYSDVVVLDEVAQMHPDVWGKVFRPALSDRKGKGIFIGTPAGRNEFYQRWIEAGDLPGWCRAMYKVTETGAIDIEEIQAARREMTDDEFEQEYMCSFDAAVKGAFYGKEMKALEEAGRVMSVPHDPTLGCVTAWDLGIRDSLVVTIWQIAGSEFRMIDHIAAESTSLPDIVRLLQAKPYVYKKHILPHDVRVRELATGKSRLEILQGLGLECDIAPNLGIMDGIQTVRNHLSRCVMDSDRCREVVEALKLYRTEYDDRRKVFKAQPVHDWTSHYADSVRYFFITDHRSRNDLFGGSLVDTADYDRTVI